MNNTGVQGKNNAYYNVNKVQNQGIYEWIFKLIDIVVCVVFALYFRIKKIVILCIFLEFLNKHAIKIMNKFFY
jgi:hypothetical protein